MKFEIPCSDLARAVGFAARSATTQTIVPAFSGVRLWCDGGAVMASCTDAYSWATFCAGGKVVDADGQLCLPSARLLDILRAAPGDSIVEIAGMDGWRARVKIGGASYQVSGYDPADQPPEPEEDGPAVIISSESLELFGRVLVGIDSKESSSVLLSVSMEADGERLSLATASLLGCVYAETAQDSGGRMSALIPSKSARVIADMACDGALAAITMRGNTLSVSLTDGSRLTTSLIDDMFPTVVRQMVTDPQYGMRFRLAADETIAAVRAAGVMGAQVRNGTFLARHAAFEHDGSQCLVVASSQDGDAAIPLTIVSDEPFRVGFNSDRLAEWLRAIDAEAIEMQWSGVVSKGRGAMVFSSPESRVRAALQPLYGSWYGAANRPSPTDTAIPPAEEPSMASGGED